MAFIPYQIVADRLPKLRAGHFLKIGAKFYKVSEVRRGRIQYTFAAAIPATKLILYTTTSAIYTPIVGDMNNKRVVHLQYISCSTVNNIVLWWLTEPMLSKHAQPALNSNIAGLTSPYEVDKWTYDESMNIQLSNMPVAPQTLTFELIEYAVEAYTGIPSQFLELTEKGESIFHGF